MLCATKRCGQIPTTRTSVGMLCNDCLLLWRASLPNGGRSACVAVERDGKFAAIRSTKNNGSFELPGGKCEPGESFIDAAIRECFEEVGVRPAGLAELCRYEVGGYDCQMFIGWIPSREEIQLGQPNPEGEPCWASREDLLLRGTYPAHAERWLPLYDAIVSKR